MNNNNNYGFYIFLFLVLILIIYFLFNRGQNNYTLAYPLRVKEPLISEDESTNVPQEMQVSEQEHAPAPEQVVTQSDLPAEESLQFVDNKQKQIAEMNNNQVFGESDMPGFSLSNSSLDSYAPVNINVSYNNNRPISINDFTDSELDTNTKSLDNYLFDNAIDS